MRSPDEIRAEIERLRKERKTIHAFAMLAFPKGQIAALEWVLANEQPKPAQCTYCRGKGRQFEAFTMEEEHCLHCNGTGYKQDKPKETGE